MMDSKTAKRLETIENNLVNKFRKAEEEEQKQRNKKLKEISTPTPPVKKQVASFSTKLVKTSEPPLTVATAKKLENIKNKLQHQFTDVYTREIEEQREREKKYEAITKAIKEKQDKDDSLEQKTKEWLKKQKYNQMMTRFRPRISSTP